MSDLQERPASGRNWPLVIVIIIGFLIAASYAGASCVWGALC